MLIETVIDFDGLINHYIEWFECNECGVKFPEQEYHYEKDNFHLCNKCTFKSGKANEKWFLASMGIYLDSCHAGIKNNKIELWFGNSIPPWEKPKRDRRTYPKYQEWRKAVFERDNYTCQDCKKRGGKLESHHIKSFAKYPDLRLKISNGITYCEECHKGNRN